MWSEMSERETAEAIEQQAAAWVAKLDREDADAEMHAALEAWIGADERRRGAYFRASAAWRMLDRASVLSAGAAVQDFEPQAAPSRRRLFGTAIAAGLVAAVSGFAFLRSRADVFATAVGEIKSVPLADGSLAELNTGTELAVTLRPDLRSVALKRGEAWFHVAKDRDRPFVVAVDAARVRAVGTAFSVRRRPDGAEILVTEGSVEVWGGGDAAQHRQVAAGYRAFVRNDGGATEVTEAAAAIERALAWRSGQIVFDGDTLAAAAAEFNRYNQAQIAVDPALASEPLVGRFGAREPDSFARAAAAMLGAHATVADGKIRIAR